MQVGVPEGRAGGGAARQGGPGRGRQAGPREASTARRRRQDSPRRRDTEGKGCVVAGRRRVQSTGPEGRAVPAMGEGAARGSPEQRARAAHAMQAVRRRASVPHAVWRRDRRTSRTRACVHLRHRRPAHLSHGVHWTAARIRRTSLRPSTAIRLAGGKATRWSSTPSATTRASGWTATVCRTPTSCTPSSD